MLERRRKRSSRSLSLGTIIAQVEERYPGWYFNPARWTETSDGFAPFPRVIEQWQRLREVQAFEHLETAIMLRAAHADAEVWIQFIDELAERAMPDEGEA